MISLPVFGLNILFPYGMAVGVCASVVSLNIISVSIERAVERGRKGPVILGFIVRILLYCGAFWLAVRTSGVSGLGAAIGFLLPRITMQVRYALLPWLRRKLGKEPRIIYKTDTQSNVFVKEPWLVRYNKGKAYVTHRHYKKAQVVQDPQEKGSGEEKRKSGRLKRVTRKAAIEKREPHNDE